MATHFLAATRPDRLPNPVIRPKHHSQIPNNIPDNRAKSNLAITLRSEPRFFNNRFMRFPPKLHYEGGGKK